MFPLVLVKRDGAGIPFVEMSPRVRSDAFSKPNVPQPHAAIHDPRQNVLSVRREPRTSCVENAAVELRLWRGHHTLQAQPRPRVPQPGNTIVAGQETVF